MYVVTQSYDAFLYNTALCIIGSHQENMSYMPHHKNMKEGNDQEMAQSEKKIRFQ